MIQAVLQILKANLVIQKHSIQSFHILKHDLLIKILIHQRQTITDETANKNAGEPKNLESNVASAATATELTKDAECHKNQYKYQKTKDKDKKHLMIYGLTLI